MTFSGAGVAEDPGRRRSWIALRLSIALATALIVAWFTAAGARADYPRVSKHIPATTVHQADCPQGYHDYPFVSKCFKATTIHPADRPHDIPIDSIMIHDTEGSWQSAVNIFTGPTVSAATYLVSSQVDDPAVTQFAPDHDWVQSVDNWWFNETSIGIEHVGFAAAPAGYFNQELYKRSADLTGWVAWKYHVPVDRAHILGHDNIPTSTTDDVHIQHWDPGPSWDWPYYMTLVRAAYKRWSHNAPLPKPAIPVIFTKPSSKIRMISVGDKLASARDWFLWSSGVQSNYTNVYADKDGRPAPDTLVRGASNPSTFVPSPTPGDPPTFYDQLDFSCDNFPSVPATSVISASDLRAKAVWGEDFALLGRTRVDGILYDKINFNGTVGWVRDSDTSNGWGALVRFRGGPHPTTLFSGPDPNPTYLGKPIDSRICPDTSYDFTRAGQTYVSQVRRVENGETWYQIDYNHRVAWVPADEVAVSAP
ncbi:MAG: N-acetylmuramoyl-L-alanine amidase [Solirubrobacteraceae bacterium]